MPSWSFQSVTYKLDHNGAPIHIVVKPPLEYLVRPRPMQGLTKALDNAIQ